MTAFGESEKFHLFDSNLEEWGKIFDYFVENDFFVIGGKLDENNCHSNGSKMDLHCYRRG